MDCIDDIKSNDGESMTHYGQVLRQVYRDECDNIGVRRRFAEEDHEEGYIYVYEYVSKTKCKKFCRRLYTLYKAGAEVGRRGGREASPALFENQKKCPDFAKKKALTVFILRLNLPFKM